MEKTLKKACSLLCIILIAALMFSGCTKGNSGVEKTTGTAKPSETEPEVKDSRIVKDGSVTLTIVTNQNYYPQADYSTGLPVLKAIEEKTGVKIQWEVPSGGWLTVLRTKIAANDELPDIIRTPGNYDVVKFGTAGVFQYHEELIEKNAPNFKKRFKENPVLKALQTAPDGHIYALGWDNQGESFVNSYALAVREDWLDKLNIPEPKTIDDWYNMLKLFKTKDPNQNGKDDEVGYASDTIEDFTLMSAGFGLHSIWSKYIWPDANNKLQNELVTPAYREFLTFMNRLASEKLVDPNWDTATAKTLSELISSNVVGASTMYIGETAVYNSTLKGNGVADAKYIPVAPPQGAGGQKNYYEANGPLSVATFGITRSCKNPDIAMQWLDYVCASPEGIEFMNFGINGKSYTKEGGEYKFTDFVAKNPDGLDPLSALRSLGALAHLPRVDSEKLQRMLMESNKLVPMVDKISPYLKLMRPTVLDTPEEAKEVDTLNKSIDPYVSSMMIKFINGTESLQNFDSFVQKLKELGLDRLMEIKQIQYDRFLKATK